MLNMAFKIIILVSIKARFSAWCLFEWHEVY